MNTVKTWAVDTASRCVKTFSQTLAGLLGFGAIVPNVAQHVPWHDDLAISGLSALACLLYAIQSFPTGAIDGTGSTTAGSPIILNSTSSFFGPDTSPSGDSATAQPDPATGAADPSSATEVTVVEPAPATAVAADPVSPVGLQPGVPDPSPTV